MQTNVLTILFLCHFWRFLPLPCLIWIWRDCLTTPFAFLRYNINQNNFSDKVTQTSLLLKIQKSRKILVSPIVLIRFYKLHTVSQIVIPDLEA